MGIESEFLNARREIVRTSAETKRSLLAAMGVNAGDAAQTRDALDALDRADWLQPLPPVAVVQVDADPPTLELVLPAGTDDVAWRLVLEDGSERTGVVNFAKLDFLGSRTFEARRLERRRFLLPDELPWGYHRLAIDPGDASMILAITPRQCWLPPVLAEGRRLWGITAQLYLLRSDTDWGIGDFRDLRKLVELASGHGADVIGLNPLHAMFSDDPEHASPYSPASRLLLNVLNIDVTAVPELADCLTRGPDSSKALGRACRRAVQSLLWTTPKAASGSPSGKLFDARRVRQSCTLARL
jgi:hypothetical protein